MTVLQETFTFFGFFTFVYLSHARQNFSSLVTKHTLFVLFAPGHTTETVV